MSKSKQLNFFITPDDLKEIDIFLKENACLVLRNNVSSESESFGYDIESNTEKLFQVFLSKEEFKNNITFNYLESKEYYYVYETSSYVIEFGIGGFYPYSDKEFHRSRLYFIHEYYKDGILVKKSPEFVEWANTLMRNFKKRFLVKHPSYSNDYFSEQSINWVKLNNAKLESGGQKFLIK